MRRLVHALSGLLLSVPLHAAAAEPYYDGWLAKDLQPGPGNVAEDVRLACEGQGCADNTLRCTTFHLPAPASGVSDLTQALDMLPHGQIAYWLAARIVEDRSDLIGDNAVILGGGFDVAFTVDRMDDHEYAFARSKIGLAGNTMNAYIALWLDAQALRGVHCSYLEDGKATSAGRIDDLLRMLLGDGADRS